MNFQLTNFQKNIPLAPHTTFRIGGPAKYFYEAKDTGDIIKAVKLAQELNTPYFILGEGSNVLISDNGFKGLIIKVKSSKLKVKSNKIIADAGVKLSKLVDLAIQNSLSGLEWAAGIPGTVGGAVRGNAGAFGSSISDVVKSVQVLRDCSLFIVHCLPRGSRATFRGSLLKFGYRDSILKHNKDIILSVELQLKKDDKNEIKKRVKRHLTHRKKTQPIKDLSAGCIFKNTRTELNKPLTFLKKVRGNKPAAQLIEEADLKGKIVGGAMVSEKHANFIINTGKAKAEDVIILIGLIKAKIRNKFGVQLQEEIEYISTTAPPNHP